MKSFRFDQLPRGFHRRRISTGEVGFTTFIWRGGPGPVLLVNGATHGDEYEGPHVLRMWAETWRPKSVAGTVVFIPVLNEAAFFAGQRCHPDDGGNLARAFPGRASGGPTSRLAHLFDREVLAQCTHYVDLHSAGASKELDPWVGYMIADREVDAQQLLLAQSFDSFWCWSAPPLPQRTLSAAHARRIPAIYVECRGAGGVHSDDARALDRGLRQTITRLGIARLTSTEVSPQRHYVSSDADESHLQLHHPCPGEGLFRPVVALRQRIRRGDLLGQLFPLERLPALEIRSQRSGQVVTLRRQRSVRKGDSLATVLPR